MIKNRVLRFMMVKMDNSSKVANGKYGFDSSPHSSNYKMVGLVGEGEKVLDVGCASGYLAKELRLKKALVYGVEVDPKMSLEAKKYCIKVVKRDIEKEEKLPFPEGFFDVIVLGDILEHLRRPDLVLKRLKKYLRSGGKMLVSIPNVARIEIRLGLLLGRFDYQESGILKKDHLRFFTLHSIRKMFDEAGLSIDKIDYTGLGSRIKIFPTLLAFQFLIVCHPQK